MATFKILLDKRSTKGEDKHHLSVRVSTNRINLYLRLGPMWTGKEFEMVFIKKAYDKETDKIRKKFEKFVDRAKEILPLVEPFDPTKFRTLFFDKKFDPKDQKIGGMDSAIKALYEKYIEETMEMGRISRGTKQNYKYNLRSLIKYKPNLKLEDLTPDFLTGFENWFIKIKNKTGKNNSLASVGNILRSLRSVLNYNIKRKRIPSTFEYPFNEYKVPNYTPPKFVISNKEIQSIIDCKEFGEDLWEEYARDIWVLLYRMNGINFVDLLKMRWDNIQGNHIIFTRHKTRKTRRKNSRPIRIFLSEKIRSIIDKIGDKESPFILGQIKVEEYDENYLFNRNLRLKVKINRYLKMVGKRLNLSMPLDISLARDSYANTLKRANVSVEKIAEQLNHSDPRITQNNYLDMFDEESIDGVNEHIL